MGKRRSGIVGVALFGLALLTPVEASGKERLQRLLDQRDGLPVSEVSRLVQDRDGFLWVGTRGGLVRYDGNEVLVWAPETLAGHIAVLAAGPQGEVLAGLERGRVPIGWEKTHLFRIVEWGVEPFRGPGGIPLTDVTAAEFATDGSLWIAREGKILRRDASGQWTTIVVSGEEAYGLGAGPAGGMLAITGQGLWLVTASGAEQRLLRQSRILVALAATDGNVYAAYEEGAGGRLVRIRERRVEHLLNIWARPLAVAMRGDTVWTSWDRYLVAFRPGEAREIIGPADGLPSGGPLLVDHEGSLWVGTFEGLLHFSEPDTVIWTDRDGLPSRHTTYLGRGQPEGGDFWMATWQGLGRMVRSSRGWRPVYDRSMFAESLCPDRWGHTWFITDEEIREYFPQGVKTYRYRGLRWPGRCSVGPDGTAWILTNHGVLRASKPFARPELVTSAVPVLPPPGPGAILYDSRGGLWIGVEETVCHATVSGLARQQSADWSCDKFPHARNVIHLIEGPGGAIWAATARAGVWRHVKDRWVQFAGSARAPYQNYGSLRPAGEGGVWLLSEGGVARVVDGSGSAEDWKVVERLSSWQGVPSVSSIDLLEEPDGALWIASVAGLTQVPARARRASVGVPRVRLVGASLNGSAVPPESAAHLPARHLLELRFAALSFRDRTRLRYQVRVRPEEPWREISGPPVLRYVDLGPGRYRVEMRASLDGEHWSAESAQFAFEVLPPWYRRSWAMLLFGLMLAGVLYAAHRVRMAVAVRLEGQRARIAMDLHDEIGSGLGSMRILAGLAAEPELPQSERATAMGQIAETAGELGAALSEIVWSLRPGSGQMDVLAGHLVERAARLFPGASPVFKADIPESLPRVELTLSTRRNVALIALEALHNAARHAGASHVTLGLAPYGRKWRLWVSDDGQGMPSGPGAGMGLQNMRERAAEIGADLVWSSNHPAGTCVTLLFDPQAESRRG